MLLVSIFSTESSSFTVRHKEEADRGCCVSLCSNVTSCYRYFVRLSNFNVLLLLRCTLSMFWNGKVDKSVRKGTRNEKIFNMRDKEDLW